MKNLLMLALALVTMTASAQEPKKESRNGEQDRKAMLQELTPQEIAELQTKKMTLHLDLSTAQQTEVKKILLEEATMRKTKMAERKAQKENAEKPSKDERVKMMNERLDHQIALKNKMKNVLNAEQMEKWEQMQAKRKGIRGKRERSRGDKR